MGPQMDLGKPLESNNEALRQMLGFESSDDDLPYDKGLVKLTTSLSNNNDNIKLPVVQSTNPDGESAESKQLESDLGPHLSRELSSATAFNTFNFDNVYPNNNNGVSLNLPKEDVMSLPIIPLGNFNNFLGENGHESLVANDKDSSESDESEIYVNSLKKTNEQRMIQPSNNNNINSNNSGARIITHNSGVLPERPDNAASIPDFRRNSTIGSVNDSSKRQKLDNTSSDLVVDLTSSDEESNEVLKSVQNMVVDSTDRRVQREVSQYLDGDYNNIDLLDPNIRSFGFTTTQPKPQPELDAVTGDLNHFLNSKSSDDRQHEVIVLSDYSSTDDGNNDDDDDDDDDIQILDVKTAPTTLFQNNNNNVNHQLFDNNNNNQNNKHWQSDINGATSPFLQSQSFSFGNPETNVTAEVRRKRLEFNVENTRNDYNMQAQRLIDVNTKKRRIAENIQSLKKTDALLSLRNDPISKSMVASGRTQIQQYSKAYNDLVRQSIALEKFCEGKRREYLNNKLILEKYIQNFTDNQVVNVQNDPMSYNRAYQNAIMSQSDSLMRAPRGYMSNIYTDDSNSLQTLLNNIKPDETYVEGQAKTPDGLGVSLLPHQRIGLAWLQAMEESSNKGGILADDMGLGKTVQTLALMLANVSEDSNCKTNLIVAPIALLKQWQQEVLSKIKPEFSMKVFIYHQQDKLKTFAALKQYDVVLISYSTLASEMKKHYASAIAGAKLAKNSSVIPDRESGGQYYKSPFYTSDLKFYRVILDEAQWIKNKLTQASKSVTLLESELRWCLSGTPMQNSVEELYSLIRFLRIRPYNEEGRFRNDIFLPIKNGSSDRYDSYDTSGAMKKLQLLLKAILLRRTKDAKIDGKPILELPEKKLVKEDVEMFDLERTYYESLESHSAQEADELLKNKSRGNYSSILTLLLRLRQLCCHKYLVEMGDRKSSGFDSSKVTPSVIREMESSIVRRVQREAETGFTCPICFDSISNEKVAILSPCGHVLCQDCISQFFEQFQSNNDEEAGSRTASCMSCRGMVKEKLVFNYEVFDLIHNKNFTDEQVKNQFTHDFKSNKKSDRRKNLLRLIEEDGGFKSSLKIDICIMTIEKILNANEDEKIIVFSQFTLLFEIIRIVMDSKKIPFLQYDGSMNSDDRNATIGEFYRNPTKRVLLLSLKAGNVGLTLTCANHVIIMDPFWNPFVEEQAMDRAHRIGQQRPVHVHKLLIKNTIEDRILLLQDKKKELINGALDSEGLSTISKLGRNEIRFLFGLGDLSS